MDSLRTLPVHVAPTTDRKAERGGFERALRGAAGGVASGIAQSFALAAPFVPGGPILAGAVRGALAPQPSALGTTTGGAGPSGGTLPAPASGGLPEAFTDPSVAESYRLLQLQSDLQRENREFTLLSNVLKVRHDTAKAVVQNLH